MQFIRTLATISALIGLMSCAPHDSRYPTVEQTAEKIDIPTSDTVISVSIITSAISKPGYDPSKDTENKEMYNHFAPYVNKELLNVEQENGTEDDIQCFVHYLGVISDLALHTEFHVVAEFCRIKTATSHRGNSKVAFVNEELKYAQVYYLDMPEELPFAIEKNALLFNIKGSKKGLQFEGGLPDMLCIPGYGCY
jgi:hypothetical protein